MKNYNKKLVGVVAVSLVILYLLNYRLTNIPKKTSSSSPRWTVYGTNGCGWTRKQLEHMKSNRIPHKFVDCDKENCDGMNAFPTLKGSNGETIVGFSSNL